MQKISTFFNFFSSSLRFFIYNTLQSYMNITITTGQYLAHELLIIIYKRKMIQSNNKIVSLLNKNIYKKTNKDLIFVLLLIIIILKRD